jgi:hypothetical protein
MRRFFKSVAAGFLQGRGGPTSSPRKRRALLGVEGLEARTLLSAAGPNPVLASPTLYHGAVPAASTARHSASPADFYQSTPNGGFTPSQIRHAYGFDQIALKGPNGKPIDGAGQTIAIVDAFNAPFIRSDLQAFDKQFGLPDPPNFTILDQNGGTNLPPENLVWAGEIALDVEWAHAIAPGANILLIEANDASGSNLYAAVDQARSQPGVVVVSMSWGDSEFSGETGLDLHFTTPAGHVGGSGLNGRITFVAAAGDHGQPPIYPATSPNVLAVGGTVLSLDVSGNYAGETGWSNDGTQPRPWGGGGGLSSYEIQPTYQAGVVTQSPSQRGSPDVAYEAAGTMFAIFNSSMHVDNIGNPTGVRGWEQLGGTSAGAPQWAALVALVDQGLALSGRSSLSSPQTLQGLYSSIDARARDFHDVTSGYNGYLAGPGYDLVTGLGSPRADKVVADLTAGLGAVQSAGWSSLGGHDLQQIAMGVNYGGRLEAFAVGGNQIVYFNRQTPTGAWGGWGNLPIVFAQSISVVSENNGALAVVALGMDNAIYYTYQSQPGTDSWVPWKNLGGVSLSFVVGTHYNGALEIFTIGTNHQVYKNWESGPDSHSFQGNWDSGLGRNVRSLAVGNNGDKSLQLFAINADGSVSTDWEPLNQGWQSWKDLGGSALKQLALANNYDSHLEVFALGGDNQVHHLWQLAPSVNSWSTWYLFGGYDIQQVVAARRGSDGLIQVDAVGGDRVAYQQLQAQVNGGWSGSWASLGGTMQQLLLVPLYADSPGHLVALGRDGAAYTYGAAKASPMQMASNSPASALPPSSWTAAPLVRMVPPSRARAAAAIAEALVTDLVRHGATDRFRHGHLKTDLLDVFAEEEPMPPPALEELSSR